MTNGSGEAQIDPGPTPDSRSFGLDIGKLFSLFAVICIHTQLTADMSSTFVITENQLARFAVPFFFIVSGYVLSSRLSSIRSSIYYCATRIVPVFVFWMFFYNWERIRFGNLPLTLEVLGSFDTHLWYFPSVIVNIVICSVLLKSGQPWIALLVSFAFYLAGCLHGSYEPYIYAHHWRWNTIHHWNWNTRNGPFFGLLFVSIGACLARVQFAKKPFLYALMFVIGGIAQVVEVRMLAHLEQVPLIIVDYVFSTILFACGAFLFFLSLPNNRLTKFLSGPGRFVLGAYGIHIWVTGWPMASHNTMTSAAWSVAGVWGMSLVISQACSLIPLLRFAFK